MIVLPRSVTDMHFQSVETLRRYGFEMREPTDPLIHSTLARVRTRRVFVTDADLLRMPNAVLELFKYAEVALRRAQTEGRIYEVRSWYDAPGRRQIIEWEEPTHRD